MRHKGRWPDLAGLIVAAGSAYLLACVPAVGWYALGVGGVYPLLAWRRHRRRFNAVDVAVLVFCLSALTGVATSYDTAAAWAKFRLVASGGLIYLALSIQPRRNLSWISALGIAVAVAISLTFLFGEDWLSHPSGFAQLRRATTWWMAVRPNLPFSFGDRDLVGGALTIYLPFMFVTLAALTRKRIFIWLLVDLLASLLCLLAFASVTERGAILGLFISAILVGYFELAGSIMKWPPRAQVALLLGLSLAALGVLFWLGQSHGGVLAMLDRAPGSPTLGERLDLAKNTLHVALDTPYTGGGLAAFSGLYSRYALIIPVVYLTSSHNLFLDILTEQGFPGLIALLGLWGGSLWILVHAMSPSRNKGMKWAALATAGALIALLIYGLVEDPFYDGSGLALMFVLPAIAVILSQDPSNVADSQDSSAKDPGTISPLAYAAMALGLTALAVLVFWQRDRIVAAWYADVGSVAMEKVELSGWPATSPGSGPAGGDLDYPRSILMKALRVDPQSVTARYRLGLIALDRRQFSEAADFMAPAIVEHSDHRGLTKALGYAFVWEGKLAEATPLLEKIPEASTELGVYAWWWGTQDRPDLSEYASREIQLLASSSP